MTQAQKTAPDSFVDVKNIGKVVYDGVAFETWYPCLGYFDPDQKRVELARSLLEPDQAPSTVLKYIDELHVCHGCFKYSIRQEDIKGHIPACTRISKPPGNLVYKSPKYAIRRVQGSSESDHLFCQCMCLFGKLFLDSKTIFYAVDGFEFYVLYDNSNNVPVGFFSKELNSWDDYNLACILVFPPFQSKGLGKLLIAFSYHLSQVQNKEGSPERPLSKYGWASYMSYWCQQVCMVVANWAEDTISVDQIAQATAIRQEDIYEALKYMGAIEDDQIYLDSIYDRIRARKVRMDPYIDPKYCVRRLRK